VSVERLYLEEYANDKEGAWWGLHCEGALLRALFSLLLFEQLFLDVPGAFVSRHQDAPLDLHQPWLFCKCVPIPSVCILSTWCHHECSSGCE
jgi:hypothetical protein